MEEIGPSFDMIVRRTKFANDSLMKEALKLPPSVLVKPTKNIEKNTFGDTLGRIHMQREDIKQLGLKKPKRKRIKDKVKEVNKKQKQI